MQITPVKKDSNLLPDANGKVDLLLIQASTGFPIVGDRDALAHVDLTIEEQQQKKAHCLELLKGIEEASIAVMSFHPGLMYSTSELESRFQDQIFVGLGGIDSKCRNVTYIAEPGVIHTQPKISLASEDIDYGVVPGNELFIFTNESNSKAVQWAVLNCHDYTHVEIIKTLLEHKIELLIVVTFNPATRLYWENATADIHRLFCYVVIANVSELGGSGVFAPFRRIGRQKSAQIRAGGQIFGARGPADFKVKIPIDISELRSLRVHYQEYGLGSEEIPGNGKADPILPPEHYLNTFDHLPRAPSIDVKEVKDIETTWNFDKPRVAIAQLKDMGMEPYIQNKYRIRNDPKCPDFEHYLNARLNELEERCKQRGETNSGSWLDMLVFPEVFIPRSFIATLQEFSNRLRSTIVAGVDYPDGDESANANECVIIRPNTDPIYYRKITRSKYDAVGSDGKKLMKMCRGDELIRFVNEDGRAFGVLICYDYSHFDLIYILNMENRSTPLDVLIVVAHNPFSELYRSCCVSDSHRFYQYIVMCNVSDYGGSGIFGPCRTKGSSQVILDAGKGVEAIAIAELDLSGLNEARSKSDSNLNSGEYMRRPGIFQGI